MRYVFGQEVSHHEVLKAVWIMSLKTKSDIITAKAIHNVRSESARKEILDCGTADAKWDRSSFSSWSEWRCRLATMADDQVAIWGLGEHLNAV